MTSIACGLRSFYLCPMPTPAVSTPSITSVCPECGTMKKSGKRTCCGSGGSWFGKCGSAGNANIGHTWYEGIRACEAQQSKAVISHQLHVLLPKSNVLSDNVSMRVDSKAVIGARPKPVPTNISIIMPARTSAVHDAGTTPPNAITATIAAIIHMSVSMSIPKTTIPPVKETVAYPANQGIVKSPLSTFLDTRMIDSSHTSASVSIPRWELLPIATHVSIIFVVILWSD